MVVWGGGGLDPQSERLESVGALTLAGGRRGWWCVWGGGAGGAGGGGLLLNADKGLNRLQG